MEKDSPSKPSVAELAGRFKGQNIPMPNDELRFRRRPPCSLKLKNQMDDNEDSNKSTLPPTPPKVKPKNSAIIEKLQANLALSPTALLPSPKSPEVKLHPTTLSPTSTCSPLSPLSPTQQLSHPPSEEEDPVSFETPPESVPLLSVNKTRARLSFKRRPPTRQHRRSAGEEADAFGSDFSQSELSKKGEDDEAAFHSPAQEVGEEHLSGLTEDDVKNRNCEMTTPEAAKCDSGLDEEKEEEAQRLEALDEEQQQQLPDQDEEKEVDEETPQGARQEENDGM